MCALYKANSTSINEARFQLFCSSTPEERSLPPTKDCLLQHARRASYQAKIWRLSTVPMMNCPSPDGHGWKLEDGQLNIYWMEGEHAPAAVLKVSSCSCKVNNCAGGRCSCFSASHSCTELCHCGPNCTNKTVTDNDNRIASDSEDEL